MSEVASMIARNEALSAANERFAESLLRNATTIATLRTALAEALSIIDDINGCHGCLDNMPESTKEAVARLAAIAKAYREDTE